MKWFKFYGQDYLSDPKMLALSASERSCWITLLSYSSINDNGVITFLSEDQLMAQAGLNVMHEEWDRTIGVLQKLESLEMIHNDNGKITVINWAKRQETNLTGYERVKRYREKKRDDNAKITSEENRIDKNTSEAELRVESFSSKEEDIERAVKPKPKYPHAKEVFSWFPRPEKSWLLNTTELKHAELLWERGEEKVKGALGYVQKHKDDDFFLKVTKPSDLERKWVDLVNHKP